MEPMSRSKNNGLPKNRPSRIVTSHCSADVEWLENSTSFGGHSRPTGGHRRVSGLVRASLKRESRKRMMEELKEAYSIQREKTNAIKHLK